MIRALRVVTTPVRRRWGYTTAVQLLIKWYKLQPCSRLMHACAQGGGCAGALADAFLSLAEGMRACQHLRCVHSLLFMHVGRTCHSWQGLLEWHPLCLDSPRPVHCSPWPCGIPLLLPSDKATCTF